MGVSDELEAAAVELAAARRFLDVALLAAAAYVEELAAEGDDRAAVVTHLVADAERRCQVARFHAAFQLPLSVVDR